MRGTHLTMKDVRIGCSGWVYDSWRRGIYKDVPPARWLERYAEVFDTVEVNNTFYRLVKRKAVEGWVERTPPGFLFAVKGSRYLTHMKPVGELAYVRFHHGARGRNGNYSPTEIERWRRRIAAWRSRREVFAYFNNDWEEFAPPNAISLREGLSVPQLV